MFLSQDLSLAAEMSSRDVSVAAPRSVDEKYVASPTTSCRDYGVPDKGNEVIESEFAKRPAGSFLKL
jgi:hypothetical protein